ncbi:MAG: glycoside hydrolase family 16 protein [Acidobacteriaceae bacterium]|nr:glycoside hydrolase family 16 protein [Acidobacteriaceae bacterium]
MRSQTGMTVAVTAWSALLLHGCAAKSNVPQAAIQITRVPQADSAGGTETEVIEGTVSGASSDDRVVLYAQTGTWWVQPLEKEPLTRLDRRLHWINGTHLGTKYAALLVDPKFTPANNITELPGVSGLVKAVTVIPGQSRPPSPYISFSGYQWRTRTTASNRGGTRNRYAAENIWTDRMGALHLQITGGPKEWICAEITLAQSLGYGTYSLQLRDLSKLEPSAVFAFFTYDYAGGDDNHREMNIEVSRWGDASIKNGQYIVQPFHVPTNVSRFLIPAGSTVHSLQWEPGRMAFSSETGAGKAISQHVFVSAMPQPGLESPRMAFYVYNEGPDKQARPAEVVVDKFRYLP